MKGNRKKPRKAQTRSFRGLCFFANARKGTNLMPSQPAAGGHVYTAVRQKSDALFLQKAALHFGPAKGIAGAGAAVLKHHAVAGNDAGLGVAVQGVIPCHRVVFQDGSTCTGYAFGGPEVQRRMLEDEGVRFLPDGRVDMAACRWL